MRRVLTGAVAVVLLAIGMVAPATAAGAVPAAGVAAVTCVDYAPAAVFGGYRAQSVCDSRAVHGFGTTAADATLNRRDMQYLAISYGMYCATGTLPQSVDGGYRIGWACNSRSIQSVGTTLKWAANNGFVLAEIAAQKNVYCLDAVVNRPAGGFRLQMACNSRAVENYGTTLTDAGVNVSRLARIAGDTGYFCGYASFTPLYGAYRLTLTCNSQWATQAWGDNLSEMGRNTNKFVTMGAYPEYNKRCATVTIHNAPNNQYRAVASCTPGGAYEGYGSTIGQASYAAYYVAMYG